MEELRELLPELKEKVEDAQEGLKLAPAEPMNEELVSREMGPWGPVHCGGHEEDSGVMVFDLKQKGPGVRFAMSAM